jgi:hypothetical protein
MRDDSDHANAIFFLLCWRRGRFFKERACLVLATHPAPRRRNQH